MKQPTGFLGTYFDRDGVLQLERWVRIIAIITLASYCIEAAYTAFQSITNAIAGGYPLDWFFIFQTVAHITQGGVLFILLQAAAKILLILLDIEDNTRRSVRAQSKES